VQARAWGGALAGGGREGGREHRRGLRRGYVKQTGYTRYIPLTYLGFPWYIHTSMYWVYILYIPGILSISRFCIYWLYTGYIRGITFKTRFLGRPVLLVSVDAHTCVGDQQDFSHMPPWQQMPGEKAASERLNQTYLS
jgi:hypothetical protein